jgi:hypothetical protein
MRCFGFHTAAIVLLIIAPPSLAADSELAQRFAACMLERDDARRLACFDRAAAQLPAVEGNVDQPQSPANSSSATAPRTSVNEEFGVLGSELARKLDHEAPQSERPPERITATITEISKRPRGELVFTLDNGQVWVQKDPGPYFPAKPGDSVAIIAGTLGSFRLVDGNRSTQVTRIQ